jgi:AcrR family transcriptional regulator
MARPQLHSAEVILDAARTLVLDRGLASATVGEIARVSGAPTGSIYHRFGSRDDLLARLWIRGVRRSQQAVLDAAQVEDPMEAAVAAAMAVYDFCDRNPADARLLLAYRRDDLLQGATAPDVTQDLRELNRPVEQFMRRLAATLYGRANPAAVDRVVLATFDLPHGAVRRPLLGGGKLSARRRRDLEVAVRAVLTDESARSRQPVSRPVG